MFLRLDVNRTAFGFRKSKKNENNLIFDFFFLKILIKFRMYDANEFVL